MDEGGYDDVEFRPIITIAAVIAIIIAVVITGYLVIFAEEQHSSLYLTPESYQNQAQGGIISFTYGVICSENEGTDYEIQIYLDDNLMATEAFRLENNGHYVQDERLRVADNISYPAKVQVLLTNLNSGETEEVHFWIEGNS